MYIRVLAGIRISVSTCRLEQGDICLWLRLFALRTKPHVKVSAGPAFLLAKIGMSGRIVRSYTSQNQQVLIMLRRA